MLLNENPHPSIIRCTWCLKTPLYIEYHDSEWGVENHDDRKHFEFLILESAQSGLSWLTILNKREGYRELFLDFDPKKVAAMNDDDVERLMHNPAIVRNRLKINAAINNAERFINLQQEFGSFDTYIWSFVNNTPKIWDSQSGIPIPATTKESDELSKDLKKRGFKFLGSTVMYAHMQAMGLVDDHIDECFKKTHN